MREDASNALNNVVQSEDIPIECADGLKWLSAAATFRIRLGFMKNVHNPITMRSADVRLGALRRERFRITS